MKIIKKVLVANRSEIATRIMRTLKDMGLQSGAVFSESDRHSPHVFMADQAFCLGESTASESYLSQTKILAAAKALKVDAIHPGYGFLSENADFAQAVKDMGFIFIGPSPHSIRIMGSKLKAKEAVSHYAIPLIPGTKKAIGDIELAKQEAEKIGYPILIKASAGGGGKGMRVVYKPENLENNIQRAISEAKSAFGDGAIFIEKYIENPKHIEVQILGDQYGHIIHLFERECSIQRRHQKVIEEAPSSVVSPELRKRLGDCAVQVAKACNYYGAGTVEFIVDKSFNFYFLEMNTRLQVEHPVTEEITGIDLVKEQIKIAERKKLTLKQSDLTIRGHALEVRVYAEDPSTNFLPDIGRLNVYKPPKGNGVRVDDGYQEGMQIPIFYDPMLAKLITYGKDRPEAIQRMVRAIEEYNITGVKTTLSFCLFVLKHPRFLDGTFDTKFVENYFDSKSFQNTQLTKNETQALLALINHLSEKNKNALPDKSDNTLSLWAIKR